uniref:Small integral membrane protein 15 n=1 Tax=Ascaris lumbricoides TaxID=6252 RepID=A0A0M3HZG5_ASCLU
MFDELHEYLLKKLANLLIWAADDPTSFFATLFLAISPLLLISALLSWKLRNAIIAEKKVFHFSFQLNFVQISFPLQNFVMISKYLCLYKGSVGLSVHLSVCLSVVLFNVDKSRKSML